MPTPNRDHQTFKSIELAPRLFKPYAKAILSVIIATIVAKLTMPVIEHNLSLPFMGAVAYISWQSQLKPAIFTSLLSTLAINYFFMPPQYSLTITADSIIDWVLFTSIAFLTHQASQRGIKTEQTSSPSSIPEPSKLNQIQQNWEETEKRYRTFVEQSSEGIWCFDMPGSLSIDTPEDEQIQRFYESAYLSECNDVMAQMYGFTKASELIGVKLKDFLITSDPKNTEYLQNFISSGYRISNAESHEIDKEGNSKYFLNSLIGIIENGYLVRAWGTQRDITLAKQLQQSLEESEKRFRIMADTAPVLIWMSGQDQLCNYFNKSWLDFTGRTMEQESGNGWTEGVHPEDFKHCLEIYSTSFYRRDSFQMEYRLKRHDGEYRWLLDTGIPRFTADGRFVGYIGSCVDITERKQAEVSLKSREEMIRLVTDSLPYLISYIDKEERYVFINHTYETWFKRNRHEIVSKPLEEVVGNEIYQQIEPYIKRALSGEKITYEETLPDKEGLPQYIEATYVPHFGEQGEVQGFVAFINDISERRATQEKIINLNTQLQRTVAEFETLLEVMPIGIGIALDPECRRIQANPYFAKWLEIEVKGNASLTAIESEKPTHIKACKNGKEMLPEEMPLQYCAANGVEVLDAECEIVFADGKIKNVLISAAPLFDEENKSRGCVAAILDITERKRNEKALQNLLKELSDIKFALDKVGIVSVTNPTGQLIYVNDKFCEISKFSQEELLGKTYISLNPDSNSQEIFAQIWQQSLSKGKVWQGAIQNQAKNGRNYWVDTTIVPFLDAQGKPIQYLSIQFDITERVRAEEQERFLARASAVLASSLDYSTTLEQVAQLAVPQLADWCTIHLVAEDNSIEQLVVAHVDPDKVKWARALSIRYPFDPNEPIGTAQVLRTGISEIYPEISDEILVSSAKDPEHLEILRQVGYSSVMIVPIKVPSRILGVLAFVSAEGGRCYDPIDLGFAEDLAYRAALAIENAKLYQNAHRARAEAETLNRIKDEFLATLSHELRTPLTSILGWATLLQTRSFNQTTLEKALDAIERNAKSQAQLIEDLLDVSRIITGKLRLNIIPVNLNTVLENALDAVRPAAAAKSIEIQTLIDPAVSSCYGDQNRLQQVIWNLLSNAIKFTPKGGSISVKMQQSADVVEITVSDTGIGINPNFLPFVFERFRQADSSSTRSHGGLGLGLAIVRHLVELHGGSVSASSLGLEQGATFTVKLPLVPVESKETLSPAETSLSALPQTGQQSINGQSFEQPLYGLRVLVVDDEPDTGELLEMILADAGASVILVASASAALQELTKQVPDILVSDIEMPAMDGYQLIRQIRSQFSSSVPAIALTAYARLEDQLRAKAAGFQKHIAKPVEPVELVKAIAGVVGRV
ncbi:PAS domain S-box protein [Ancylothrix sp. C2]|uniref:PAS domain S-box protein n=1 Tax=Ancylothrix sp. D3o TaxID=2953691 RepID=UPI0021BB26FF|nr:PAS domain S-box protein [Ancylothrix sp. D3o]MCT7949781.1 PAS domain S-box protein [Ancylothrix sp. D3o]